MQKFTLRVAVCLSLVLGVFLVCIARIILIIKNAETSAVSQNQNIINVDICSLRGNIFDTNGKSLTTEENENCALITPCKEAEDYIKKILTGETKTSVLEKLENGKPATVITKTPLYCQGITNIKIPKRNTQNLLCKHLIGYTDYSGHGVVGLEKIFDDELYTTDKITAKIFQSAYGKVLSGAEIEINGIDSYKDSGVVTTIDKNIQYLTENAALNIKKGAVLVSEVQNGKIRAMVSKPDYDIENIAQVLNDSNSPLINRCLLSYNVGSVFKPVVAAAGLENGLKNLVYDCTGNVIIGENTFNCHNRNGHGVTNMQTALKESCNSYFYRFCSEVGANAIYNTAKTFGFGNRQTLYSSLFTQNEQITPLKTLQNYPAALANLSIGQGQLLASPVTMLSVYEAIANGGLYYGKTVIESIKKNGEIVKEFPANKPTRAFSQETANTIKEYLKEVVESGTGTKAKPQNVTAAGKTATAQTGQKNQNGKPLEHSWFCGFFPADTPKYTVCVLIEDINESSVTAAEVFKKVADYIYSLE